MKTVEELNDYWDAQPPQAPTMTWAEMVAHSKASQKALKYKRNTAHIKKTREEKAKRVIAAMADGPVTRNELAAALGISYYSTRDWLTPLLDDGRVARYGFEGRTEKFGLSK